MTDEILAAAQEWLMARSECCQAPNGDPEFKTKLNRLANAEDALARAIRALQEGQTNGSLSQ